MKLEGSKTVILKFKELDYLPIKLSLETMLVKIY